MGFGDMRGTVFKGACSQPQCPSRCPVPHRSGSTGAGTRGCAQPALGIRTDTGAAAAASGALKPPQHTPQKRTRAPNEHAPSLVPSWQLCLCGYGLLQRNYAAQTAAAPAGPDPQHSRCRRAPSGCSGRKRAGSSGIICRMSCYCRLPWR